jgi:hypothetical protein
VAAGDATLAFEDSGASIRCTIQVRQSSLHGHAAELRVVRKVVVKDTRPVHASDTLYRASIARLAERNVVEIPRESLKAFSYEGKEISIRIEAQLKIDDGLVFDTTLGEQMQMALGLKPAISEDAKGIVDPADAFEFVTNLKAIPPANQAITLGLLVVGAIAILFNTWLGWHDQWSPETLTLFYDQRDSDGDSQSPFFNSLIASGAFGAGVWLAIKRQLRKYMTFEIVDVPPSINMEHSVAARRLLRGRSRVDLNDVVVRIVGCNMEMGQYKRGSGTKERTVSFRNPVRAVILYDRRIDRIAAGKAVEDHLDGEISFGPMFRALYPPQAIGTSHGLAVHWEVQLIHDQLVDQEIVCRNDCFVWADFLKS